jgi:hypothetical protein
MYSDTDSPVALSDSSYDSDLATSSDSDFDSSDSEYDPNVEIVEKDEEDVPTFYDVDDPCIEVGVVFSDVKKCKKAVTQHAIIQFMTMLSDPRDHITTNLEPCAREQVRVASGGFMLQPARINT